MLVIFELECGGKYTGTQAEESTTLRAEVFDEFLGDGGDKVYDRRGRGWGRRLF